jgi:hypothetical protein
MTVSVLVVRTREPIVQSSRSLSVTQTSTPPAAAPDHDSAHDSLPRELMGRITRLEIIVGAVLAAVMLLLVLLEPNIVKAPFQNERTLLFTLGGTGLAAIAFIAMLWLRVPSVLRVIVLVVPFVIVNWWLISPYFIDDVVNEEFSTSITDQLATASDTPPATGAAPPAEATQEDRETTSSQAVAEQEPVQEEQSAPAAPSDEEPPPPPPPAGPLLLGAGQFVGLAGHSGTGDAGIFQNPDGPLVLRFENFDIENGPDLEVYLVPGSGQASLAEGSIHLGALKGNIGNQSYELPPGTELAPGAYTALVWCEAFSVEFVGATIVI